MLLPTRTTCTKPYIQKIHVCNVHDAGGIYLTIRSRFNSYWHFLYGLGVSFLFSHVNCKKLWRHNLSALCVRLSGKSRTAYPGTAGYSDNSHCIP